MAEKQRFQRQNLNTEEIKEKENKARIIRKIGKGAIGGVAIVAAYVGKKALPVVAENAPKALAVAKKIIRL